MQSLKRHSAFLLPSLLLLAIAGLFVLPGWKQSGKRSYSKYLPVSLTAQASEINRWSLAVQQIKADRGEPTGKQAKVDIPHQVRHYGDTRRFLAIQVAEVKEHGLRTPQDLVELGDMIAKGEMVSLSPATEKYVLFGVGAYASKKAFTHYVNGKSIPVYNEDGLRREHQRISDERLKSEKEIAALKQEIKWTRQARALAAREVAVADHSRTKGNQGCSRGEGASRSVL